MGALAEGPHEAHVERIVLGVDGMPVDAVHARPVGAALGGVALVPDVGGLRPLFDDLCRRLASHGLAVCAIEPFARIPAEQRAGMALEDRLAGVRDLYDELVLGDLAEAADHLQASDGVHGVAAMGFCMGGYYTLKAAATGRYERAVSFYGMVQTPEQWQGPGHRSPLETIADVCPTLYLAGTVDPWVPESDARRLQEAWRTRGDCKVLLYPGADHGFVHDPDRPAHQPEAAEDAWRHALAFLMETD